MIKKSLFLFFLFAFVGCQKAKRVDLFFQKPDGRQVANFSAEIADTPSSRQLGLMYRKVFGDDEAMLFIFSQNAERSFWMKNTYIELDIIFLDNSLRVVSIVERAVPLTETPRKSLGPAQYVLEIKGGLSRQLGITPGMEMKVRSELPPGVGN